MMCDYYPFRGTEQQIVSVTLNSTANQLEVIRRIPTNIILTSNPPQQAPDEIWKDIYRVNVAGKIVRAESVRGTHTPKSVVPESFTF